MIISFKLKKKVFFTFFTFILSIGLSLKGFFSGNINDFNIFVVLNRIKSVSRPKISKIE